MPYRQALPAQECVQKLARHDETSELHPSRVLVNFRFLHWLPKRLPDGENTRLSSEVIS